MLKKDIILFGDSHLHFFTFMFDKKKDLKSQNGFYHYQKYNITFIYKYGASALKFNKEYIYKKIEEYNIDISNKKNIIFSLGTTDLRRKIKSIEDIDLIVEKYIKLANEFSKENNLSCYFLVPIINVKDVNSEYADYFINSMYKNCKKNNGNIIDIYDIIDRNYSSEIWDMDYHLSYSDIGKTFKYMMKKINI